MSTADVVALFHETRDPDYRELAGRYRKLLQALERKTPATRQRLQDDLGRIQKAYEKVRELDFFDAPGRAEVERLREVIDMRTRPSEEPRRRPTTALDLRELRRRQWVTRPRPHVDRVASAWFIKRFIDATFVFAGPRDFPADAIPFDAPGVELGHEGTTAHSRRS